MKIEEGIYIDCTVEKCRKNGDSSLLELFENC